MKYNLIPLCQWTTLERKFTACSVHQCWPEGSIAGHWVREDRYLLSILLPASFLAPRSCRMQIFKRHFSSSVNEWSNHCWPKWCTQLKLRDIILILSFKCESRNLAECQTWWHLYHPLVCISTIFQTVKRQERGSTSRDKIWWQGYWRVKNHFSHWCNRYIYSHILSFSWQIVFHCKKQEDKCAKIYSAITQLELQKIHRFSQS